MGHLFGMGCSVAVAALVPSVAAQEGSSGGEKGNASGKATASANSPTQAQRVQLTGYLSHVMLFAFVGFAGAILVYRISHYIVQYLRTLACLQNDSQRYFTVPNVSWARFKNHILYAPLFRRRHNREFQLSSAVNMGTLPTRLQASFLITILVANVTLCVYDIPWSGSKAEVLPLLRNRSGTLSVANLIPIMVMNGPKNPLIKLLNISYESFNMMHRWFGRLAVLQAIAHTLCWLLATLQRGGWTAVGKALGHSHLIMTGMVATCAFVVILLQSPSAIRHAFYEIFLHLHIALAVLVLVFLWMHLGGFPQRKMLGLAIGVWAIYRFLRLASIVQRNLGRGGTKAAVECLPGDALRVSFTSPHPWTFRPGQYMYVCIPSVGLWTSHPFSVAWSDWEAPLGRRESMTSTYDEKTLGLPLAELDSRGKQTLSAVIRRRTGFTNTLYEKAEKAGAFDGAKMTLNAYIEGPYGNCRSMSSYGTVMLFAGGVGITHQVPYVRELVEGYAAGTVAARQIILIWVIQSPEHLEWIRPWMTQILAMERRRDVLSIKLFITRPRSAKEVSSPSATVQMFPGRPSIETLIGKECENMIGCMGVSVCGTGEMQDEVRRVVRQKGRWANLEFVEESFSW